MTNLAVVAESSISFAVANLSISARVFFCPPSSHHDFGPILIVFGPDAAGIHMRHFFFVGLLTLFCLGFLFLFFFWFWPGIAFLSRDESRKMEDFLRLRQARHINYSFRFWFAMPAGYPKKKPAQKKEEKNPARLFGRLVIYKHARRFG